MINIKDEIEEKKLTKEYAREGLMPSPPPGEGWTQYEDSDDDVGSWNWWHYEGPLGMWWCPDDDRYPTAYEHVKDGR